MAVEIELKIRLDGPETVKQKLSSLGSRCRSYEKSDTYWIAADRNRPFVRLPPSGIRVRREIDADAEGRAGESALVTYKTREMRDGIEINDEREFAIVGPRPDADGAAVFEDLLERLGLEPGIRKEKRGWAWTLDGQPPVLAELSLVKNLGWFLELEILADVNDRETIGESQNRLLSLLETLDIPPDRIETRPYSEMLRGLS
jgi:adenylate cyclase class 2